MSEHKIDSDNPIEERNKKDDLKKEIDREVEEGANPPVDEVIENGLIEEQLIPDDPDDKETKDEKRENEEDNVDRLQDGFEDQNI